MSELLFSFSLFKRLSVVVVLLTYLACAQAQDCNNLPVFTVNLNNQTINASTTYPAGTAIRITGTVNFNANVTMISCTVLMDPGAVLNINNSTFTLLDTDNDRTTTSDASFIFGCTQMWQAINVNVGGAVVWRNSIMRDGVQGLTFNAGFNNGSTEIEDNTFSSNTSAITANNVSNLSFSRFKGNRILGKPGFQASLLPPHNNNPPMQPIYGMRLNNVTGSIGTSGTPNTFQFFSTGLRADGSTITVNNCTFSNNTLLDWEGFGAGIGIWTNRSSLTIQDFFSGGYSCQFIDNRRAVRSDQTVQLTVKNAFFSAQRVVDVEVISSVNPYVVNISSNTIKMGVPSEHSIFLERAWQKGGIHTHIQSNIITLPAPPLGSFLTGNIKIMEVRARAGATDQAVIANNQITCTYGNANASNPIARVIDGIWVEDVADGYQVSGNIINYVNPATGLPNRRLGTVGIGMTNVTGVGNIVGPNNTVTTTNFGVDPNIFFGQESWLHCGIHINNCQRMAVCKNDVDGPRHGYHFASNCDLGEYGRNKIRDAHFGLIMSTNDPISNNPAPTTFPNNHDYRKNEWIGTYVTNSARWGIPPQQLQWLVDGTQPGHAPPNPFTPPSWFVFMTPVGGNPPPLFCDQVIPPPGALGEPPTGDVAQKFVDGGYPFSDTVSAWDFERDLLTQMIRFPNTFSGNTTATQYYNGQVNTVIWQFAKAERMLHESMAFAAAQQQSLDDLYANNIVLTDSLGQIEQWEGLDTTTTNAAWQTTKTDLLQQLDANRAAINALLNSIRGQQLANMEGTRTYIGNLPANNLLETNRKTVLWLLAKQYTEEVWTPSDSTALRAVAYSCPYTGGTAVTMARGMLPHAESSEFVREGEDPYCQTGPRNQAGQAHQEFTVWPNPADQVLMVAFAHDFSGRLEVVDMTGRVLLSKQMQQSQQERFDTQTLPIGAYLLRCIGDGEVLNQAVKFSILR
jgi:hypothetical protein